jgi:uncharacterized beta-barrel protein YwiB (DUF1934 family)
MKKNIDLEVIGNQIVDGEKHTTQINTTGTYEKTKGGFKLVYEDCVDGETSTTSIVEVLSPNEVNIVRNGEICANMSVYAGERHQCHYQTPFGGILLGVSGDEIEIGENSLHIKYTLDLNPTLLSKNEVDIRFSERS